MIVRTGVRHVGDTIPALCNEIDAVRSQAALHGAAVDAGSAAGYLPRVRLRILSPTSAFWLLLLSCVTQGCEAGRETETGDAETPAIVSSVPTSDSATMAQTATRSPAHTSATRAPTVQTPKAQSTGIVPSPDGEWTASEVSAPDPSSSMMLVEVEVEHVVTGERWRPISLWESGDTGSVSPKVIGWRPNSAQVVLATVRCGGGCVINCGHWLSVFDVERGTTPLPSPLADPTLDPTGRYLAGFGYEARELPEGSVVVADLDAGTVVSATFPAETQSAIAWAPDGSALAFTITDSYAICAEHPASHLARFEIATGEVSALTPVDDRHRRVLRWNADNTLEIAVFDGGMIWFDREPDATELRDARSGSLLTETVTDRTPDAPTAP